MHNERSWTQNQRDWWTAYRVNPVARYSLFLTVIGIYAFSFWWCGLQDLHDHRAIIPGLGACALVWGGGMLLSTNFGYGTVKAIRRARKALQVGGRLSPPWWSKAGRAYCARVGYRAAAYQAGRAGDVPERLEKVMRVLSGKVPFVVSDI